MSSFPPAAVLFALTFAVAAAAERPDVVVADFEAADYGEWTTTGEAFGDGPAAGTLPGQMQVDGFEGQRLVNSFHGGDGAVGTLTSPPFEVSRDHLNLLVGGGGYEGETCVNLRIDGKVVRTAVGPNLRPGGRERLLPRTWDVSEFAGRTARIEIVDARRGGWGHINVDQIVHSDAAADVPPPPVTLERPLVVDGSHLLVPIANPGAGGETVRLGLFDGDRAVQTFNVSLPLDGEPNWTAAYPLNHFDVAGRTLTLKTAGEPVNPHVAAAFEAIAVGPESRALGPADWTRPYRNAFHLAPRRGWNNDPNGLVYHDGLWHVFYQYNPFGIEWGNMHWGHYTSPDLTAWTERPIALFQNGPDDAMFSGGGFVDAKNSAGLGAGRLFVAFTSTGRGECLAHSADGLTFTELPENPVVKHTGRDPKIFRHEPTEHWVMAVYQQEETAETRAVPQSPASAAREADLRTAQIAFYRSADLRTWERTGAFTHPNRRSVFECPELFELPVLSDGGPTGETRWVLYGADNRYFLGDFDGKTFAADSGPHGDTHGAFYAAQTFNNAPDGRRIQIGWLRTALYLDRFPDQTVNQCLSLPHELTLHATPDGPRLRFTPVAEAENLRTDLRAEGEDLSAEQAAELLTAAAAAPSETLVTFAEGGRHTLTIDGVDASFEGTSARIFTDRTVAEIYVDGGHRYVVRTRPDAAFQDAVSRVAPGDRVASLRVYGLKSIWPPAASGSPAE
ncbi:glycoside hydrolase family 32 protein [Alienimonas californiensis]|uniref:Levanase n=1 Tax=Alienimonas californiensis TaxID=2527989 RepID=A0A517PF02_9PLAN|nr:glycoside hydrolase family 32 protein [Alienimonas californiensis]QDT17946.1 Levanase precursor [Alienimonas californiensis]